MGERSQGLYKALSLSAVYDGFQRLVGAPAALESFVSEYVRPSAGCSVLDLGAGTGTIQSYLPRCNYTAVEPNPKYVRRMRERFRGSDNTALVGGAPDFPDVAGLFDRVLILGVLHHVDDDVAHSMLGFAADRLAPGGFVLTWDPVVDAGTPRLARLVMSADRGRNIRSRGGYRSLAAPYFGSIELHTRDDLLKIPYEHCIMALSP